MSSDPFSPNPYQAPVESGVVNPERSGVKSRHGCATAYLVVMVVVNALASIANVFLGVSQNSPSLPRWLFLVLFLFGCLNVVCAVALLRWKKWGFYGFMVSALLVAVIDIMSTGLGKDLLGLVGVAILYGVLQIGGKRSTWSQLE